MVTYVMFGEIPNKSIKNIFYEELYPLVNEIYEVEKIPIETIEEEKLVFKELESSRKILEDRIQNSLELEFDRYPNTDIRRIAGTHAFRECGKYQIFGTSQSSFSRYFCREDIVNNIELLGEQFKEYCHKVKNIFSRNETLFLTSYGTLDLRRDNVKEMKSIKDLYRISQGRMAIITGWDWITIGEKIRESYTKIGLEPLAIYTEGGTMVYIGGKGNKTYGDAIVENYARKANGFLIRGIYNTRPNAILRAQNNEMGYCYYIDVDSETAKQIDLPIGEKKEIGYIKQCLIKKGIDEGSCRLKNNRIIIHNIDRYDQDGLLENICRVMGREMTLLPFKLQLYNNSVLIELVEGEPDKPIKLVEEMIIDDSIPRTITKVPEEIKDIVNETMKIIRRSQVSEKEDLIKRIVAQNDICIDVFVHPKDWLAIEWDLQLDKLNLPRKTKLIYLTKGTESDLTFLDNLYAWVSGNRTTLEVIGHENLPSIFRTKDYFRTAPNTKTFYDVINSIVEEYN